MATKQQVNSAIKRRYGKRAYLTWGPKPSSSKERDRIAAIVKSAKDERDAADAAVKAIAKGRYQDLVKQVRFFVDTGSPTAIQLMQDALVLSEVEVDAIQRRNDATDEYNRAKKMGGQYYYQYQALRNELGLYNVIEAQADSLTELLEKIEAKAVVA
jgi:hypothetical protein